MKLSIYSILVAILLSMISCNFSHNKNVDTSHEKHDHGKKHDHKHDHEDDHDHDHDHGEEHKHSSTEKSVHDNEIGFTDKQAKAAGLEIEVVEAGLFYNVIKTSGQIQASQGNEQTIVATSSGIVSFVNNSIVDGTSVSFGETVVNISAKKLQEGDPIIKAKIAFEIAEKEFKRAETLIADKIISTKEFEQIKLRYETAKASYQGQATHITSSGVGVTSPINGYIKNRLVSQGEYVSVGQAIVTVVQNKRLQLRAEVSENYFKQLKNISSANFKTSYDNVTHKLSEMNGKFLSYGKSSSNNSFYIPVTFEFDNVGDIVLGSFAEVYLLSSPRDNVISVPVSALTEEQGLNFVYIKIEPEVFIKQEVSVGQNNGERAEIIKGLYGGEKLVIKGVTQVKLAAASGAIPDAHNH